MKRFLILLTTLFCGAVFADTINLHWRNYDGTTYEDSTCVIDSDLIIPSTAPTRYGYTFTGWKFASYRPIEYLESTGTQWVKFGNFYTNNRYETIIDIYKGTFGVNYSYWLSGSSNVFTASLISSTSISTSTRQEIHFFYTPEASKRNLSLTNGTGTFSGTGDISSDTNGWFFGVFGISNDSSNFLTAGKIYSVRIIENDILIHDLIPVLDKNDIPCLFDRVKAKFYYNAGTGQFIAGPTL